MYYIGFKKYEIYICFFYHGPLNGVAAMMKMWQLQWKCHHNDVKMNAMASQTTSLTIIIIIQPFI